jgi:hypothetical protein
MKKFYKIVEEKDGVLKTLFHGIRGSKFLMRKEWLEAETKLVNDGKGTKYISGFHIMPSYEETKNYLNRFKKKQNKVIITCYAKDYVKKKHSRNNVYLADYIYIL